MEINRIYKYLENWAPHGAAWEKDNTGLQCGSLKEELKNTILCLEVNRDVIKEAIDKKCNLIISHHPLIFRPLKKINPDKDITSELITEMIKNNITMLSYHTSLDFTRGGVSFQLAEKLGLKNVSFLENHAQNQMKIAVFVPHDAIEAVSNAAFEAGGGIIGEYSHCSYRLEGRGTFLGSDESNPAVGEKGKLETADEIRLEVIFEEWKMNSVIGAMIKAHPYEEPAYDIYKLENRNVNYGAGVIGELEKEMTEDEFLEHVSQKLDIPALRYTNGDGRKVKRAAVCGGSGSDLSASAEANGADAFVTADIKYHGFHDYENRMLLIDAGHYETEVPVLDEVKRRLETFLKEEKYNSEIYIYRKTTNPVNYFTRTKGA